MQTSVNQEHGPNRGAVGETQATACSETTLRRSRSTLARYASRAERCSLGFAHGCSLARSARPLSTLPNLPSPLSAVAARRHAGSTFARARRRFANARQTGSVGDLHRRQLQFGEKRGPAVGPTRRGKGSKIMAIADRHGLPVACCVTSASPHETKLVEATVAQRFTRAKPKRMIGDRAYDSDPLDQRLRQKHGIRLIAPHKYKDRKSTRLNSSHSQISYAVFCLKKKKKNSHHHRAIISRAYYTIVARTKPSNGFSAISASNR